MFSFLSEGNEDITGREEEEFGNTDGIRNLDDLLYSARWLNGSELGEETGLNVGFSGAIGPNRTGNDAETYILGGDVYTKWQPARNQRGFPFVAFQAEALYRNFENGVTGDPVNETLEDWGGYAQGLWGFSPGWVAGLRIGAADGDHDNDDNPFRDGRVRLSPNLSWYPSEFSTVRLQYNRDWFDFEGEGDDDNTADSLWLQVILSLGAHSAHTF